MRFASPFVPPRAVGPCFRTDAEGRIPLARDWLSLFSGARPLPRLVLQTRHRHARLLTLGPAPALARHPDHDCASSEDGSLHLRFALWRQAWGHLGHCPCCGSPGRVEVHDSHGAEFLQLCAHSSASAADWAGYLAAVAAPLNATAPVARDASPGAHFARLPAGARLVSPDPLALRALLAALEEERVPFACTLHVPAARHTRELAPRRVACDDGLLTVGDGTTTLQADLGAAQGLAVWRDRRRADLHLAGPGGSSLLTLGPAADPAAAFLWHAALRATFPGQDTDPLPQPSTP